MRALFKDITNTEREEEQEEEDCKHVVKVFKHNIGGNIKGKFSNSNLKASNTISGK